MSWAYNNTPPGACGDPVPRRAIAESDYSANTPTRARCSRRSERGSRAETEITADVSPVHTWRLRLAGDKRFCHVSKGHTVSEVNAGIRGEHTSFGRQPPPRSEAMTVASTNVISDHGLNHVGVARSAHRVGSSPRRDQIFKQTACESRGGRQGRSSTVFETKKSNVVNESTNSCSRDFFDADRCCETPSSFSLKRYVQLTNGDSPPVINDGGGAGNPTDILGHTRQYSDQLEKYNLDLTAGLSAGSVHETQLSPVTISSGYESDYVPSPTLPPEATPEFPRDSYSPRLGLSDNITGHLSQSDTYPISDASTKFASQKFGSLRRHPEKRRVSNDVNNRSVDPLVLFSLRYELDVRSSAKSQNKNHKLAKVARSMYEIIHDLRKQGCASLKSKRQTSTDSSMECGCNGSNRPRFSPISSRDMNVRGDVCLNNNNNNEDDSEGYLKPRPVADDDRAPVDPAVSTNSRRTSLEHPASIISDSRVHAPELTSRHKMSPLHSSSHGSVNKTFPVHDENENENENILQGESKKCLRFEGLKPGQKCFNSLTEQPAPRTILQDRNLNLLKVNVNPRAHNVKVRDPLSDSEHIYETIPGDENMVLVVPHHENSKLAKWLTIPNLTGSTTSSIPPALPERRYNKGSTTDISTTKASLTSLMDRTATNDVVQERTPAAETSSSTFESVENDSDSSVYAKVCRYSKESRTVLLDSAVVDEEDDGLYSEVIRLDHGQCQVSQETTFKRHVYLTDVSSENYCRLEPIRAADDINQWSSGDILNFIDGIHENNSPKRRENILQLLGNSKTCAKLSESLEIETRLLHKGLLFSEWYDDDGDNVVDMVTSSDPPIVFDVCHLEPTYV